MDVMPDIQLIEAYRQADGHAGEILYTRYYPRIVGLSRRYLKSQMDAEDVAQEVMLRVLAKKKILMFRHDGELWSWLYRITVNACMAHWRKQCGMSWCVLQDNNVLENQQPDDAHPGYIDHLLHGRMKKRVLVALMDLPSKYRRIILKIYFEDRTYLETARECSVSCTTVGVQLLRAKKQFVRFYRIEQNKSRISPAEVFMQHFDKVSRDS
ncbi:sigma-70 family RNA polymerase sigma factor [bacterium]|nr:sigma-70 family RNA polymerase sigma factor [bacterium]